MLHAHTHTQTRVCICVCFSFERYPKRQEAEKEPRLQTMAVSTAPISNKPSILSILCLRKKSGFFGLLTHIFVQFGHMICNIGI